MKNIKVWFPINQIVIINLISHIKFYSKRVILYLLLFRAIKKNKNLSNILLKNSKDKMKKNFLSMIYKFNLNITGTSVLIRHIASFSAGFKFVWRVRRPIIEKFISRSIDSYDAIRGSIDIDYAWFTASLPGTA